ncbi:MAG: sigma-70 family RNA polymerase sigma factor [Planctomycetota bacterium]
MSEVTSILSAIEHGDGDAIERLLPIVYGELRVLAQQQMNRERSDHTLQATALVHEAYMRLVDGPEPNWPCRGYFFAAAAEAMRRILIDQARSKGALKRGGGRLRLRLDQDPLASSELSGELLDLDQALSHLSQEDSQKADLVKLRFFAGLTMDEAAAALGISSATADRHWRYARAWLYQHMSQE